MVIDVSLANVHDSDQVCATLNLGMSTLMGAHDGDLVLLNMCPKLLPTPHIHVQKVFKGVLNDLKVVEVNCMSNHLFSCRSSSLMCSVYHPHMDLKMPILVFLVIMAVAATSTFTVYVLNANGIPHPMKIHHFNMAVKMRRPHAFIVSESKTKSKMSKSLPSDDYDIHEELGD